MLGRAQSAIEFITTYSFLIFVVAVVIVVLVLLTSIPSSTIPSSCSIYGSLKCAELTLGANIVSGGSKLIVFAYSSVPGIINISTFNAVVGGVQSTSGFCSSDGYLTGNTSISEGSPVICVANFATQVSNGKVYSGTVNISANYCNSGTVCPATNTYTFSGTWRSQSVSVASLPISLATFYGGNPYVPINIINVQSTSVSGNFQQMVYFNPQSVGYPSHEAQDLGNLRFYQGFTPLYSWCESGCNSITSTNAVFWVNLPNGVPATNSTLINMSFQATNTEYDGVIAGESALASNTYAQYDNGGNVFLAYSNMNSYPITATENSPQWRSASGTGPTGATQPLAEQTPFILPYNYGAIKSASPFPSSFILSLWAQPTGNVIAVGVGSSTNYYSGYYVSVQPGSPGYFGIYAESNAITPGSYSLGYGLISTISNPTIPFAWLYTELDYNSGAMVGYEGSWQNTLTAAGYGYQSASTYDAIAPSLDSILLSNYAFGSGYAPYALVVLRAYPPNDIMPGESVGPMRKL